MHPSYQPKGSGNEIHFQQVNPNDCEPHYQVLSGPEKWAALPVY